MSCKSERWKKKKRNIPCSSATFSTFVHCPPLTKHKTQALIQNISKQYKQINCWATLIGNVMCFSSTVFVWKSDLKNTPNLSGVCYIFGHYVAQFSWQLNSAWFSAEERKGKIFDKLVWLKMFQTIVQWNFDLMSLYNYSKVLGIMNSTLKAFFSIFHPSYGKYSKEPCYNRTLL